MPNGLVTVVGDVFVEQFRPVVWKRESMYRDQISVYRSEDAADALRTQSPGGAAFLTLLLRRADIRVQAVLPVHPDWDSALMLIPDPAQAKSETHIQLVRYQSPSQPNRIESFYVKQGDAWRIDARVDELHISPAANAPALERSQLLAVDDYGREAVNAEVIKGLSVTNAETAVINGQFTHRHLYKTLLQSAETSVLVCTEREALRWSEVPEPPIRFSPGSMADHRELLRLIVTKMIELFPTVGHIIINRAGPPFTSVHVQCAKEAGLPHNVTSHSEIG